MSVGFVRYCFVNILGNEKGWGLSKFFQSMFTKYIEIVKLC